jgi:hypothetical protein
MSRLPSVEQLRKSGYKVRVVHRRRYLDFNGDDVYFSNFESQQPDFQEVWMQGPLMTGGYTKVEVTTPEGDDLSGIAECSLRDQFNRKMGLNIALGRALNGRANG